MVSMTTLPAPHEAVGLAELGDQLLQHAVVDGDVFRR